MCVFKRRLRLFGRITNKRERTRERKIVPSAGSFSTWPHGPELVQAETRSLGLPCGYQGPRSEAWQAELRHSYAILALQEVAEFICHGTCPILYISKVKALGLIRDTTLR